jgi:hypothetical protein
MRCPYPAIAKASPVHASDQHLSAASPADRSRRLIKCAKESARYFYTSYENLFYIERVTRIVSETQSDRASSALAPAATMAREPAAYRKYRKLVSEEAAP